MRKLLIITLCFYSLTAFSQQLGKKGIYNTGNTLYSKNSYFLAPGITYQLRGAKTSLNKNLGDTNFTAILTPKGSVGLYIAGGWERRVSKRFMTSFDVSAAYKRIKGKEILAGNYSSISSGTTIADLDSERKFADNFISLSVNANKLVSFGKIGIQNSLGANVDYKLGSKVQGALNPKLGLVNTVPKTFVGQLHYRLSTLIPLRQSWTLAPSIETPILNVYQFESSKSTLPYFNSRYRTLILSLRIIFNPKGDGCSPVYDPAGIGNNKNRLPG